MVDRKMGSTEFDNEDLITQEQVDEAIDLLNSNIKDDEARLKAGQILGFWEGQTINIEEKFRRTNYIFGKLGASDFQKPSPFVGSGEDWTVPGYQRDTGIISPTSTGTGLSRQQKTPRDL